MEIRIVVPSVESATALAERLTLEFGSGPVSLRGEHREVDIRLEQDSGRVVLHVLDAVERWLDQAGAAFAEMWLGERSYRLARWVPADLWR
jgi:hypothetical protein